MKCRESENPINTSEIHMIPTSSMSLSSEHDDFFVDSTGKNIFQNYEMILPLESEHPYEIPTVG